MHHLQMSGKCVYISVSPDASVYVIVDEERQLFNFRSYCTHSLSREVLLACKVKYPQVRQHQN